MRIAALASACLVFVSACGNGGAGGQPSLDDPGDPVDGSHADPDAAPSASASSPTDAALRPTDVAIPSACRSDGSAPPAESVCVTAVQGRFVDSKGGPVSDLQPSVCGPVCYLGQGTGDGVFTVAIGENLVLDLFSTLPHGGIYRAGFYYQVPVDAPGPVIDVGDLVLLDLPKKGAPILGDFTCRPEAKPVAAQSLDSGDVRLEIPENVQAKIGPEDLLEDDAGKQFRSITVPTDRIAAFTKLSDPALELAALFGLGPFDARFCVPGETPVDTDVRLSFTNVAKFPAGADVEIFALGSYLYPEWVKPAHFEPVATGKVTADGARIEMTAGEGIPYLTWFGLRKK